MNHEDRKLLSQAAKLLVELTATLAVLEKATLINDYEHIKLDRSYVSQVQRSQPLLDQIESPGRDESSDRGVFDTLRKLLEGLTIPSP